MAHKTHDLVVKVGEYTTRDGQTKARYENVGAMMQGDKGPFIMLKRTFSPAGVPSDGRDNILVSAFEPRQDGQQGGGQRQSGSMSQSHQAAYDAQRPDRDMPDTSDIPF